MVISFLSHYFYNSVVNFFLFLPSVIVDYKDFIIFYLMVDLFADSYKYYYYSFDL